MKFLIFGLVILTGTLTLSAGASASCIDLECQASDKEIFKKLQVWIENEHPKVEEIKACVEWIRSLPPCASADGTS